MKVKTEEANRESSLSAKAGGTGNENILTKLVGEYKELYKITGFSVTT